MDHIGFHPRSMGGSLARCSWDRFVFVIVTLQIGLPRWAVFCVHWDLFLDEPRYTCFEIYLLRSVDIATFQTQRELFQFRLFRGLSWCIDFWPIDFSGWLIYWLFQHYKHPRYWDIFPFLSLVVRQLAFWVYGFEPVYFLSTFELVLFICSF